MFGFKKNEIEEELMKIIKEIPKVINLDKPPIAEDKPYCKNCSFYELRMI